MWEIAPSKGWKVFPTGVGVNRMAITPRSLARRIPHRRGGEPRGTTAATIAERIPHRRGGEPAMSRMYLT